MRLDIAFVRTHGQPDRMHVTRSDGSEVSWTFAHYGEYLPHDLVHLVVEAAFGVRTGFWGKVADGMDPRRANAQSDRPGAREKYGGFGADREALLLSEALANASWRDPELGDEARAEAIRAACASMGAAAPALALARLRQVKQTLDALGARWRALGSREALHLRFDTEALEASFAAM